MSERVTVHTTGGQEIHLDVDDGNAKRVVDDLLSGKPGAIVVSFAGQPSVAIFRQHVTAIRWPA